MLSLDRCAGQGDSVRAGFGAVGLAAAVAKALRMLLNWRWWLAVVVAALVGVVLPSYFFTGEPHGTVAHQVWAVALKLAGAFLLAVRAGFCCWRGRRCC